MPDQKISRRNFVQKSALTGTAFLLIPHAAQAQLLDGHLADNLPPVHPLRPLDLPQFFTTPERVALGRLCNALFPQATELGAINFIEQLLTALEFDPPRIYACGPHFGRTGAPVPSPAFLPLSRPQRAAWEIYLYGSPSSKTPGLRSLFKYGVARKIGNQKTEHGLDSLFKDTLLQLTLEACFGAPEYGGNLELRGWKIARHPGDVMPRGYSIYDQSIQNYRERPDSPISVADLGDDPAELSLITRVALSAITLAQRGRVFK